MSEVVFRYEFSIPDPFGPVYPTLPSVAKFRRQRDPDVKAYGQAVREAVRTLQRQELARATPNGHKSPSASGTWHTTGKAIRKAIREQHRAQLQAQVNAERRNRCPVELRRAYEEAMAHKAR